MPTQVTGRRNERSIPLATRFIDAEFLEREVPRAHGTKELALLEHSTSSGLSQGIQMGIGFKEKHGAGSSMDLHVPGIQIDALPRLTQGRM